MTYNFKLFKNHYGFAICKTNLKWGFDYHSHAWVVRSPYFAIIGTD